MLTLGSRNETADSFEAVWREPPFAPPTLNREAIGCLLIRPPELVAAFVGEDPELDGRRHA